MTKASICGLALIMALCFISCTQQYTEKPNPISSSASAPTDNSVPEQDAYEGDGTDLIMAWVRKTGETVLVNSDGYIVARFPKADAFGPLGEGLVFVKGQGFYRLNGEKCNDVPNLVDSFPFSDGLAMARIEDNGVLRYGFIDKSGNFAIDPIFDFASDFSEDLAPASKFDEDTEKYGFIDTSGEFVIEPKFLSASSFSEGYAAVSYAEEEGKIKYGYSFLAKGTKE